MAKMSMHYGYAEQLARITKLLEDDSKHGGTYDNMLYVTEVRFALEGSEPDETIAKIAYDVDNEGLQIILDPKEWNR